MNKKYIELQKPKQKLTEKKPLPPPSPFHPQKKNNKKTATAKQAD